MSNLVPCPGCEALLRVPPNAEAIRCPQCKTVVPVAAPKPATPPVAKPPAVPLPFDRPAAPPPPTAARPVVGRPKTTVRGQLIDDEPDDEDDDDETTSGDRPKRRRVTESEKEDRRTKQLGEELEPSRTGVLILSYAAVAGCALQLAAVGYFLTTISTALPRQLVWVPVVCGVVHWLLTVVGFGVCATGLKAMRGTALTGLALAVAQLGVVGGLGYYSLPVINLETAGFNGVTSETGVTGSILLANLFNNLVSGPTIALLILVARDAVAPGLFVLLIAAAAAEFAKLSTVGSLANYHAVEGKDPELGHNGMRFIYRMFWVVIIGFVLEAVAIGMSNLGFGQTVLFVPTLLLVNGFLLWCAFAWGALFGVLQQTREIIDPRRYLDKRPRLDTY